MPKSLDLTNQRFTRLVALEKAPSRKGKTYWKCQCDCGVIKEVQTGHLTSGAVKSCGCLAEELNIKKDKAQPVVAFRKRIKMALVEAYGHKCACCGLVEDACLYDFHHINPDTKSFGIGSATTTRSRQAYVEEAKKCIMLCANCHRKIENNLISLNDCDLTLVNEQVYYETLVKLGGLAQFG